MTSLEVDSIVLKGHRFKVEASVPRVNLPSIPSYLRGQKYTRVYTTVYTRVHSCVHVCTQHRSRYAPQRAPSVVDFSELTSRHTRD